MPRPPPPTLLNTINDRIAFIRCLQGGNTTKRTLTEELDVSQSTVQRAVNELERLDLLQTTMDGYELTTFGRLSYQVWERSLITLETLISAKGLFPYFDTESLMTLELFEKGEVVLTDFQDPLRPIHRLEEMITDGDQVRSISPTSLPRYVEFLTTQAKDHNLKVDIAFSETCINHLWDERRNELETFLRSDQCTCWQVSNTFSIGLAVIDDRAVWIGFYDSDGSIKGAIVNPIFRTPSE